ncbi:MAG: cbb3-type cytochrome c oxidase subunit II [Planctomycetes bacterium]|nr:cbb3-type cytochrome c oxidase subunit II [Planctomycetota bacterium]
MDRFTSIMLFAGVGCFVFAFLLSGLYPYLITDAKHQEATIAEVAFDVTSEFKQLGEAYPVAFAAQFPDQARRALTTRALAGIPAGDPRIEDSEKAWREAHTLALQLGRDLYVGDACWHCHSQYIRPVANEEIRWGPPRTAAEENNALQRPVLFGTRRVGPDLTREGGLRSNDWHLAHLENPRSTSPGSVMPGYTWYFREGWQVFRRIDPRKADINDLDPGTAYPYPGVYDTEEEATEAMERVRANIDPTLASEGERLFVGESKGPDGRALSLVSYLQWLGTWSPKPTASEE